MENPVARQVFCEKAGGYYWPEDGSGIADPACRAAYQHVYKKFGNHAQQAQYQFFQWHEYSKNIPAPDYNDIEKVKAAIPDGQLCSAGNVVEAQKLVPMLKAGNAAQAKRQGEDYANSSQSLNDKSGMDVPAAWKLHELKKGSDNVAELIYNAHVPHSPSFWEIYITKPGFDRAKKALAWDDLEAKPIATFDDIPVEGGKYKMKVDLGDRTGGYLIYSRWQRKDSAGEGFYNCSDVNIVSSK
jgi:Uncharacterized protein conserved in bacteria